MACEQWQGAKHSIEELENRLFFPHSTNSYKNEIGKRGKRQKLNLSLAATHYWHKWKETELFVGTSHLTTSNNVYSVYLSM